MAAPYAIHAKKMCAASSTDRSSASPSDHHFREIHRSSGHPNLLLIQTLLLLLLLLRRAFKSHKPDLVVYVDRIDGLARSGTAELPALASLTRVLGSSLWLNTIVALTHAGSVPPASPKGQLNFDVWAQQKSHAVQQVIRAASGDMRLMNPMAFVDSHPCCR